MVQIPDKYKLILLATSLAGCIFTYFLPNTSRNLPSIKNMAPPIDRYCNTIQQRFKKECRNKDENSLQCRDLRVDVQDCKYAITQAYKEINVKCLRYSVQVQSCVSDCFGDSSEDSQDEDGDGCSCGDKAERLKECEMGFVVRHVRSYGIEDIVHMGQ